VYCENVLSPGTAIVFPVRSAAVRGPSLSTMMQEMGLPVDKPPAATMVTGNPLPRASASEDTALLIKHPAPAYRIAIRVGRMRHR
jgi:hypothetical protein